MNSKRDYKGVLVFALVLAIVFMSVGYAALSERLTINGTATIGDASWDVKIMSIEFDSTNSNISASNSTQSLNPAEAVSGAGSLGAKFDVTLNQPGDKAVYTVTVKNKGTIDAKLKEITDLTTTNSEAPADITFTIEADASNADVISTNDTHTYTVTVEWDADSEEVPETKSKTATIYLDYVQA